MIPEDLSVESGADYLAEAAQTASVYRAEMAHDRVDFATRVRDQLVHCPLGRGLHYVV